MKAGAKNVGRLAAVPSTTAAAMKLGAIVGGAISIFQNAHRISRRQIEPGRAAVNVVKNTVGSGLATAAGAAVLTGLGMGSLLGIVGFMTISGLSKGWWDAAVAPEGQKAATPAMEEEKELSAS